MINTQNEISFEFINEVVQSLGQRNRLKFKHEFSKGINLNEDVFVYYNEVRKQNLIMVQFTPVWALEISENPEEELPLEIRTLRYVTPFESDVIHSRRCCLEALPHTMEEVMTILSHNM